jgi:hypothetical protein
MEPIEPIIARLKRQLREAGPALWEAIAVECGVKKTLLRKIAYGDRENPGVKTVQPLITFFDEVEKGTRKLPKPLPVVASTHKLPGEHAAVRDLTQSEADIAFAAAKKAIVIKSGGRVASTREGSSNRRERK